MNLREVLYTANVGLYAQNNRLDFASDLLNLDPLQSGAENANACVSHLFAPPCIYDYHPRWFETYGRLIGFSCSADSDGIRDRELRYLSSKHCNIGIGKIGQITAVRES